MAGSIGPNCGAVLIQGIQGGDDDSANETEEQEYSAEKK